MKINPALAKVWADRVSWYATKAQWFMVLYLFLDRAGWSNWFLLGIPAFALIVWLEKRYIIQGEQEYYLRKNRLLMEMLENGKMR